MNSIAHAGNHENRAGRAVRVPALLGPGLVGAAAVMGLLRRMQRELSATGRLSGATVVWMYSTYAAHAGATVLALTRRPFRRVPPPVTVLGGMVALAGAGLTLAGMKRFQGPAQISAMRRGELVVSGIYRIPQYSGYVLLLGGLGLARGSALAALLAGCAAAALRWWVPVEEAHLVREFGETYWVYRAGTPRWLGPPAR